MVIFGLRNKFTKINVLQITSSSCCIVLFDSEINSDATFVEYFKNMNFWSLELKSLSKTQISYF